MNIKRYQTMIKYKVRACLLFFVFSLSACVNTPIQYYLIEIPNEMSIPAHAQGNAQDSNQTNIQQTHNTIPTNTNLSGPVIALSQVLIPQYLDRPQIVMREHNVDFTIAENNRWAEELPSGISRVLTTSLSKHLADIGATSYPLRIGLSPDYTINLDIRSFEGKLGGEVRLRALWTLESSLKNEYRRDRKQNSGKIWQAFFDKTLPAGTDYASYVQAYGALVDALGKEIAHVFLTLYEQ